MKQPLDLSSFKGTIQQIPYGVRAQPSQSSARPTNSLEPAQSKHAQRIRESQIHPDPLTLYPSYKTHRDGLQEAALRTEPQALEFGTADTTDAMYPGNGVIYVDFRERHDEDSGPTVPHPQVAGPAELWEEIEDALLDGLITMDDVLALKDELHSTMNLK